MTEPSPANRKQFFELRESDAAVDFDWGKLDEKELDPDRIATGIVVDTIRFLLTFCFAGTSTIDTAFRRFLAICYIIRPDLLKNRSQASLGQELKVSKSEVARHIAAVRDELALTGDLLMPVAQRMAIRAGQLKARGGGSHSKQ